MDMVPIMVPFLKCNALIWRNIQKDIFCPVGNRICEYLTAVFHDQNKMIIKKIYRMCIMVYIFHIFRVSFHFD